MIAIDSNILVRLLVADDRAQHEAARQFFGRRLSAALPGFVSLIVLVEVYWTLTSAYKLRPEAVCDALLGVLESEQVVVERPTLARAALAKASIGVADWLIHLVGQDMGCTSTVTFDRRFARQPGVELLE